MDKSIEFDSHLIEQMRQVLEKAIAGEYRVGDILVMKHSTDWQLALSKEKTKGPITYCHIFNKIKIKVIKNSYGDIVLAVKDDGIIVNANYYYDNIGNCIICNEAYLMRMYLSRWIDRNCCSEECHLKNKQKELYFWAVNHKYNIPEWSDEYYHWHPSCLDSIVEGCGTENYKASLERLIKYGCYICAVKYHAALRKIREESDAKEQNARKQDQVSDTQDCDREETVDSGQKDCLQRIWQKLRKGYAMDFGKSYLSG